MHELERFDVYSLIFMILLITVLGLMPVTMQYFVYANQGIRLTGHCALCKTMCTIKNYYALCQFRYHCTTNLFHSFFTIRGSELAVSPETLGRITKLWKGSMSRAQRKENRGRRVTIKAWFFIYFLNEI